MKEDSLINEPAKHNKSTNQINQGNNLPVFYREARVEASVVTPDEMRASGSLKSSESEGKTVRTG
jgi:hypothetical protein